MKPDPFRGEYVTLPDDNELLWTETESPAWRDGDYWSRDCYLLTSEWDGRPIYGWRTPSHEEVTEVFRSRREAWEALKEAFKEGPNSEKHYDPPDEDDGLPYFNEDWLRDGGNR